MTKRSQGTKKIFFCNTEKGLRKAISTARQQFPKYYICLDAQMAEKFKGILQSEKAQDSTREFYNGMPDFHFAYGHLLRELNRRNASVLWWSMNFTNKNPLLTQLYNNAFYVVRIAELVRAKDGVFIIIGSSIDCAEQIKKLGNVLRTTVRSFMRRRNKVALMLSESFPKLIYVFIRALVRKFLLLVFKKSMAQDSVQRSSHLIITQLESASFKNRRFEDTYFKGLADILEAEAITTTTVGFVACNFLNVIVCRGKCVFAFEAFVNFCDIVRIFFKTLKLWMCGFRIQGTFVLNGLDLRHLFDKEMHRALYSGQMSVNLSVYYAAKKIIGMSAVQKIFYPFENRSWEKMIILGIRIIGYQHASLTLRHINFLLEEGEHNEIPMPDEIVTMGHVTRDMMVNIFHFPLDRVRVGCALRKSIPQEDKKRDFDMRSEIQTILVALASNIEEYVKMLVFLDKAFLHKRQYHLVIRPHPSIKFSQALTIYWPRHISYELDDRLLTESMKTCDIALYASSTVSLEAIAAGVPVIHIKLNDTLNSDPLFGITYLKWTCGEPEALIDLIDEISKIDRIRLSAMRRQAHEYSMLYSIPATKDKIREVFV